MHKIEISGNTPAELIKNIQELGRAMANAHIGVESRAESSIHLQPGQSIGHGEEVATVTSKTEPTTRKRRTKEQIEADEKASMLDSTPAATVTSMEDFLNPAAPAAVAPMAAVAAPAATPTAKAYSVVDAQNALQSLIGKKGVKVAREIFAKYKAERISQLAPEQLGNFIADCNA